MSMHNPSIKNFNLIPEDNFSQFFLLLILGIIMFFIRTLPIHHLIFTNWPGEHGNFVNFSADDAVYHMRLVHNTIHHFPWRIFFDPFTHFPFGNQIHFGPLFTLIIAATALIAGLGHPSPELINLVGAYTPAVMGVLCLLPTYFIARNLSGKHASLITAFILTFLPGTFLQRSSLGFTDHHVAEVLFSTTTCTFLIYALNIAKTAPVVYKSILKFSILAGIAFGLFVLAWPAALMFGAIFLIFFIIQLIIDHLKNRETKYLLLITMVIYSIPAIMVLPYALINPHLELSYYSLTQPFLLITMAITFITCYIIHLSCKQKQLTKDLYSLFLAAIFILVGIILYYYAPKLFTIIQDGCKLLFEPTPGMKTVSEIHSSILNQPGNKYTIRPLWHTYFWAISLATIGCGYLSYRVYKNTNSAEVLLLTWSVTILLTAFAQCRFNYYLAINVSILAGCYCINPIINFLSNLTPQKKLYLKLQKISVYTFFWIFAILIVDPILMLLIDKSIPTGIHITREQYNTYIWLKQHTPNPQGKIISNDFDYAAGYYPIPKDTSLPYNYPKSAYGIMAWWDIGHQITYIAERIPNTNPFQLGILEKNNTAGAALFFTNTNEAEAVKNLDMMGSRYILIDEKTASNIEGIGVWYNDTKNWEKLIKFKKPRFSKILKVQVPIDSPKFLQSMLNRLYYNDASDLQHFRLIHESDGNYFITLRSAVFLKSRLYLKRLLLPFKKYDNALKNVIKINEIVWLDKEKTILAYHALPPTKNIKIFEKVKGAIITGKIPKNFNNDLEISITLKLKTKFGRIFTYKQTTRLNNGKYSFIVPYPTTPMSGDDYSYDIKPIGNYQLKIGSKTIEIFVTEEAVMLGKNIKVG